MDFLDYREKLKIGFLDVDKIYFFYSKIFNVLKFLTIDDEPGIMSMEEYYTFFDIIGREMNQNYLMEAHGQHRYNHCISILEENTNDFRAFLSIYVAFANSIQTERNHSWKRKSFFNLIKNKLTESHIPFEIVTVQNESFVFPKGVTELDSSLVTEPLHWLGRFPLSQTAWIKALKEYSDQNGSNYSDIADKFRKALETFFREFFSLDKSLENCKKEYGTYLKSCGIPPEIASNFETLLQAYTNYMNGYAKHQDRTSKNVLEYLMYQTGNIIRLLITLKQEAEENAD